MKAQNLNKIGNVWLFLRKWWWVLVILAGLGWQLRKYGKTVKKLKDPEPAVIAVPVAVENTPVALSKMKESEILVIKKYDEARIKILLLPDSALQHWADSLYNLRR